MSSLTPYDLRCEHLTEPLGLDEPSPRFGWRLRSAKDGQRQTAYRIQVGAGAWDSGWVTSGDHSAVPYAGPPLAPETR